MRYFAGIDIGSTAIKVAVVDEKQTLRGSKISPSGGHFYKNALAAFHGLLQELKLTRDDIGYIVATGYGRKLFREADDSISEITANAFGARRIGETYGGVRTIINIGGQDSKVILIDEEGQVRNFAMNDKCAAGTGRFLDMAARNLEVNLEELGECHFKAQGAPLSINSTCVVFAESEIIGLLANGHEREEIIAGIHYSIAKRIVRLAKRAGIEDRVLFDGGPALNKGLVAAMEDELEREIVVPEFPQITTALGAAVIAQEAYVSEMEES